MNKSSKIEFSLEGLECLDSWPADDRGSPDTQIPHLRGRTVEVKISSMLWNRRALAAKCIASKGGVLYGGFHGYAGTPRAGWFINGTSH